jgi:hypothetical protein
LADESPDTRAAQIKSTPVRQPPLHVTVQRALRPGGPIAIVANPYDGTNAARAGSVPAHLQDRLYLCEPCGGNGTLGRDWLECAQYTGPVWCPVCKTPMGEVEWPRVTVEEGE